MVAGTRRLGAQVVLVFAGDLAGDRGALDHLDPCSGQTGGLAGVVAEQFDAFDAQALEHGHGGVIAAAIGAKTELCIGIDGVQAFVLVAIGAHLGGNPGAAAFLVQVQQHAAALGLYRGQALAQLVAAIAFERTEQIAGQAGRVHAHRNHVGHIRLAHHDGHLVTLGDAAAEDHEFAPADLAQRHRGACNQFVVVAGRGLLQAFDRQQVGIAPGGQLLRQRQDHQRRQQQRQPGQLDGGLVQVGLAGLGLCQQRLRGRARAQPGQGRQRVMRDTGQRQAQAVATSIPQDGGTLGGDQQLMLLPGAGGKGGIAGRGGAVQGKHHQLAAIAGAQPYRPPGA